MESLENQRRVSQAFHRPLGISPKARDSHIPTARLRGHGKVENQKQVSHFPTAARDDDSCSLSENKKPKKGSRPLRGLLIPLSVLPTVERDHFHAHYSIGKCCGPEDPVAPRLHSAFPLYLVENQKSNHPIAPFFPNVHANLQPGDAMQGLCCEPLTTKQIKDRTQLHVGPIVLHPRRSHPRGWLRCAPAQTGME